MRTAEECRRVDGILKAYRAERLVPLDEEDKKLWVYATENLAEGKTDADLDEAEETKPSAGLAVKHDEEALTPLPLEEGDESEGQEPAKRSTGAEDTIVVETEDSAKRNASKWNWGLGSWRPGVVKAVYEVRNPGLRQIVQTLIYSRTRTHPMFHCTPNPVWPFAIAFRIPRFSPLTPIRNTPISSKAACPAERLGVSQAWNMSLRRGRKRPRRTVTYGTWVIWRRSLRSDYGPCKTQRSGNGKRGRSKSWPSRSARDACGGRSRAIAHYVIVP